ncbi:MAG: carboxypeptidase-like regulatory domain-containing protein, partial [Phaeodactylibacter sp.]|nr:carboxypeptidase-like regulatory domain-containing protein [Phaeodactylibacter sp.]
MKLRILTLFALLFSAQLALAQRTVTGTVSDANTNEALIGANIVVPGTSTGTITDIDGTYSLEVPEDAASLIFSYTGYAEQEVSIAGLDRVDVALSAGSVLEEVVVVGYT